MNAFKTITLAVTSLAIAAGLSSCGNPTSKVKDGTFPDRPQATIGAILDANFDDGSWESFDENGKTKVKYTGEINGKLHAKAVKILTPLIRSRLNQFEDKEYDRKLKEISDPHNEWMDSQKREIAAIDARYSELREEQKVQPKELVDALEAEVKKDPRYLPPKRRDMRLVGGKRYSEYLKAQDEAVKRIPDYEAIKAAKKARIEKEMAELIEKRGKLSKELELKEKAFWKSKNALIEERVQRCLENVVWPEGEKVEFVWVVHPNDKGFELDSFAGNSLHALRHTFADVLALLFQD